MPARKKTSSKKQKASSESGKRKRRDEEEEEEESDSDQEVRVVISDASDDEEEASEPEEPSSEEDDAFKEDEKDQDFQPPRTSRKKSTSTRKKKKDTSSTTPKKKKLKTGSSKKSKSSESTKKKKAKKEELEEDMVVLNEDKESLFATVRQESSAIRDTVDGWQERFETSKAKATVELIVFVLHSSGAKGDLVFNGKKLKSEDSKAIQKVIDDVIEKFIPDKLQVYPIVNNHPSLKHFRKNFGEFWNTFVDVAKEGGQLYDEFIREHFLRWLTFMTTSTCRALRHTSTLAIYQIASAVIEAKKSESKTLAKLQKQSKAAAKSKDKKKEKELSAMCEQYQEKTNTLEKIAADIFMQVFTKRYRDSCDDIRALSLLQASEWIIDSPDQFLNDNSLKYFGWMLNDTEESVRKVAIQILDKFYSKKDWKDQLANFTKQYSGRFVDLSRDVSVSVAVEALKFLTTLLQNGYLNSSQIDTVSKLIFDEVASIRFYAGKFVYYYLLSKNEKEPSKSKKKAKKGGVSLENILDFISEHVENYPMAAYYLVDTLWSTSDEVLRDYKTICSMINEEEGDALTLIKLLNASIKKLKGQLNSITSASDNVKVSNKSKLTTKETEDEVEELTGVLAPSLSAMIDKYRTEPEIVSELVEIPQFLDLKSYPESHFSKLLKSLKEVLNKSVSPYVYMEVAKTFKYLIKDHDDYPLKSEAEVQYNELMRETSSQLKDAVRALNNEEEPTSDILATLNRIRAFSKVVGTSQVISDDVLLADLDKILDSKVVEIGMSQTDETQANEEEVDEVTPLIINIIFDDLYWTLQDVLAKKDSRNQLEKTYFTKQENLAKHLFYILENGKVSSPVTRTSYSLLSNIFVMASPVVVGSSSMVLVLGKERMAILTKYLQKAMESLQREYTKYDKKKKDGDEEEEEEDEEKKRARLEKLKVTRTLISDTLLGLSRAIIAKAISDDFASHILSYFVRTKIPVVEEIVKRFHHELKNTSEEKLWQYEFDALKILHSEYLDKVEQEEEKSVLKKAIKDIEELGSRLSKSHFPGKDVHHIETLVQNTINFVFDDINQNHTFLLGIMKYRLKAIPDTKRKEFLATVVRKIEQTEDVEKAAKENVESFKEMLTVSSKNKDKSDETDDEREKAPEEDKTQIDEHEEQNEDDNKMRDEDDTQISETKENEEDEELISSKPRK
ncbi:hypothetical protein C9374_009844 [Naegleria lovaniensis]|uniref:SCD domain-containing protein n=1 Tax=Naegleria lovaniensis TaxID=51637 RepID=A0AA88GES2_NAELO|nr:uncharacterized protein C9374_009844 [Naegleria lovaniensis]KAG2375221.1 hypothetical protein C9374_009844 [Naegleria lovaniensis]